jgi:hypothetical protein
LFSIVFRKSKGSKVFTLLFTLYKDKKRKDTIPNNKQFRHTIIIRLFNIIQHYSTLSRVMRKKIFGQYAGGGVFWPFFLTQIYKKCNGGGGGGQKVKKIAKFTFFVNLFLGSF